MVRSCSSDLPASHGVIGVRFGIGNFQFICFNDNIISLEGKGEFSHVLLTPKRCFGWGSGESHGN